MIVKKASAFAFLDGLANRLRFELPAANDMTTVMQTIANNLANPHKITENVFLYQVLPIIHRYIQTYASLTPDAARRSIVCEYHAKVPDISSANSYRRSGHPFTKQSSQSPQDVFERWLKPKSSFPLNQAYPDLALRQPFPYNIVFDAKYFIHNSEAAARKALVDGVYEAAFYRGLPSDNAGWDYDFGCLLAFDASETQTLKAAWSLVAQKDVFWQGANIFVMIL